MKKLLLGLAILSILLPSSTTRCVSNERWTALFIAGGVTTVCGAIYVISKNYENPSLSSPGQNSPSESEHSGANQQNTSNQNKQPNGNDKTETPDLKEPKEKFTIMYATPKTSFVAELYDCVLERIREEETPKHLENLLNDNAFEN